MTRFHVACVCAQQYSNTDTREINMLFDVAQRRGAPHDAAACHVGLRRCTNENQSRDRVRSIPPNRMTRSQNCLAQAQRTRVRPGRVRECDARKLQQQLLRTPALDDSNDRVRHSQLVGYVKDLPRGVEKQHWGDAWLSGGGGGGTRPSSRREVRGEGRAPCAARP